MNLSVLITTVPSRHRLLNKLLVDLESQSPRQAEFLVFSDDFAHSIGEKRNRLLARASGDFVVFLDDDDGVHPSYFDIINRVLAYKQVDYIGYRMKRIFDGKKQKDEYRSIKYNKCFSDEFGSYRHIAHTNPIRRDVAQRFRFLDISQGEDSDWCEQIFQSGLVQKEHFINLPMYEQRLCSSNSSSKGSLIKIGGEEICIPVGLPVTEICGETFD